MRIGINALCVGNRSGTGRYTDRLVRSLAAIDSDNEYEICLPRGTALAEALAGRPNFKLHAVETPSAWRRLWFERGTLAKWIASRSLDLFHGPAFVTPPRCPCPSIVTVHDLVFKLWPRTVPWPRRLYYRTAIPRSIRAAAMVLADSASTANDLRRFFDLPDERVRVVPLGVDSRFFDRPERVADAAVRRQYNLPERYILTLGTLEPRKNLECLLKGYTAALTRNPALPDLVVAGRMGWGISGVVGRARRSPLGKRVRFIGYVGDADLPALYRLAELFVCVSLYEGFGLPVLEAMASGIPVVAGDNSSFREVVGDTSILVNAQEADDVARGILMALDDPESGRERAHRACARARAFSWEACAQMTLRAYRAVLGV